MLVPGRQICCHSNLACLGGLSGPEGAGRRILTTAWVWFPALPDRGASFFLAEILVHWATFACRG